MHMTMNVTTIDDRPTLGIQGKSALVCVIIVAVFKGLVEQKKKKKKNSIKL